MLALLFLPRGVRANDCDRALVDAEVGVYRNARSGVGSEAGEKGSSEPPRPCPAAATLAATQWRRKACHKGFSGWVGRRRRAPEGSRRSHRFRAKARAKDNGASPYACSRARRYLLGQARSGEIGARLQLLGAALLVLVGEDGPVGHREGAEVPQGRHERIVQQLRACTVRSSRGAVRVARGPDGYPM